MCRQTDGRGHRLSDRSIRNAVLPLQSCLRRAARAGLIADDPRTLVPLPRRQRGRAYEFDERRFLTREQLAALLAEIPVQWRSLFELLAATGLRISEAIGLRVIDAELAPESPRIQVRRAIVGGQLTAPKSRHGGSGTPVTSLLQMDTDRARVMLLAITGAEVDGKPETCSGVVEVPLSPGGPWTLDCSRL